VRDGGYLFQEVIEGPSVIGFGFVADRGTVLASSLHHEMFSFPQDGGSAVVVEAYESARVEELARRLIEDFQYSGWGLVEFKPCPRRQDVVLMEVNAKFWASIEFTLRTCPLFAHLLFGLRTKAEPIQRMIWPSRLLRNGILRIPANLRAALPAERSREPLTCRDWARSLFPQ
jgi:predicted ATP-grasp superfamily ATP-dependent carboligase